MPQEQTPARRFAVGLTGGIGSGKTTVADMLANRGAAILDTDAIAHQLTVSGGVAIPQIHAEFGEAFLTAEGALDRSKMRAYVFDQPEARKRLESILHPLIRIACEQAAMSANGHYLVFVVPLLVESGSWTNRVSRVLVVDCSEQTQIRRVMARSNLDERQVRAIMAAQATRKQRLSAADDVIDNDGEPAALEAQVDRLHALYLKLAAQT